jgi:small subunit ribosomal protein S6
MAEKKLYEGMFLVDSAKAASDWDGVNDAINKILEKAGAEIVSMRKWDDRKLAYDIRSTSRGTYLLCYFKVDGREIQGIEKAVQLSESIIRVLILSTEQMSQEDIDKDTPAAKAEKEKEKAVSEQAQQDEQEPAAEAEDVPFTEEVPVGEDIQAVEDDQAAVSPEQTEEAGKQEETFKAEGTEQAEEIQDEDPEDSQPKVASGE